MKVYRYGKNVCLSVCSGKYGIWDSWTDFDGSFTEINDNIRNNINYFLLASPRGVTSNCFCTYTSAGNTLGLRLLLYLIEIILKSLQCKHICHNLKPDWKQLLVNHENNCGTWASNSQHSISRCDSWRLAGWLTLSLNMPYGI